MEITGLRGFVQFGFDPRKRVVFPADLVTFISFGRGNTCYGGTHIDVGLLRHVGHVKLNAVRSASPNLSGSVGELQRLAITRGL
jgi:hypothetical protein